MEVSSPPAPPPSSININNNDSTISTALPSLPSPHNRPNSTITLPALPSNPSITLPALPPTNSGSANGSASHSSIAPGAAVSAPSSHLTIIAVLAVFVTVTALSLLWLLVFLIRRQKRQIDLLDDHQKPVNGGISGAASSLWSKDLLLQSPRNPLRRWLKDSTTFRRFTYSEIQKATDDFSSVIGKGGFGTVYKARFSVENPSNRARQRHRHRHNNSPYNAGDQTGALEDRQELVAAVKRMSRVSRQREREFCKEMEFLGRLHHRHLVTLRGFCITRTERFLIYEYMENGSLNEHLQGHSKSPLDWRTRIQIAIDVAAALEYLHFFCDPPLCHRDIKSSNILLDQHFAAKVADFGLAHATSQTAIAAYDQVSTDVRGTPGYLDPEYVTTRQLTVKSDIYSYGVLLLELMTGRAAVQDKRNLVAWAQPYLTGGPAKLPLLVDPALEDSYDPEELRSLASLVKMCTHKEGKSRPSIRQVLSFLYDRLDKAGANTMPQRASLTNPYINANPPNNNNNSNSNTNTNNTNTSSAPTTTNNININVKTSFDLSEPARGSKAYRFDTTSLISTTLPNHPTLPNPTSALK